MHIPNFERLKLSGSSNRVVTTEPTHINPPAGRLELTARADTIIEGLDGFLSMITYAPVNVLVSSANIEAILGDDTYFAGCSDVLKVVLDPHLSVSIEECSGILNGRHLNGGLYLKAPEREEGTVVVRGQSGNLTFRYAGENELYLSE